MQAESGESLKELAPDDGGLRCRGDSLMCEAHAPRFVRGGDAFLKTCSLANIFRETAWAIVLSMTSDRPCNLPMRLSESWSNRLRSSASEDAGADAETAALANETSDSSTSASFTSSQLALWEEDDPLVSAS